MVLKEYTGRVFWSYCILQPLIRHFTAIVDVPAIEHGGFGDDVAFFIPFTTTGNATNHITGIAVGVADEFEFFSRLVTVVIKHWLFDVDASS